MIFSDLRWDALLIHHFVAGKHAGMMCSILIQIFKCGAERRFFQEKLQAAEG